jgi:hypothetical protein
VILNWSLKSYIIGSRKQQQKPFPRIKPDDLIDFVTVGLCEQREGHGSRVFARGANSQQDIFCQHIL